MSPLRRGYLLAGSAYLLWGLVPIYFKQIAFIPAAEILAHRIVWSVPVAALLIYFLRQPWQLLSIVRDRRQFGGLALSALFISGNWFLFTWAVANNRILDTSLGYFINPLLTIALGVVVLREKLSRPRLLALGLAALGVGSQIWLRGELPWLSLGLATSFALYGLLRKQINVNVLNGMLFETLLMAPIALFFLGQLELSGTASFAHGSFGHSAWATSLWLLLAGIVTTVPLSLFAAGARALPLSHLGFLQYISPSCTFFLALMVYHEPLQPQRLLSFMLIWAGLLILIIESWRRRSQ